MDRMRREAGRNSPHDSSDKSSLLRSRQSHQWGLGRGEAAIVDGSRLIDCIVVGMEDVYLDMQWS